MTDLIISLDVGTTAAKAVLFDVNGNEITHAEQTFPFYTPNPGWVEQDPEDIWKASIHVLKKVVEEKIAKGKVLAISLTTQGGSLIAIGKNGKPVYPCITWMDQRAAELVKELRKEEIELKIRKICGWSLDPGLPLTSILWLRKHRQDIFDSVEHWLSINDFLAYQLTGSFITNPSMAGEMLLTDIQSGTWSSDLCDFAGIQTDHLSSILPSDANIGKITKDISRLIGLSEQTDVINGGQDHSCEALAAGMVRQGQLLLACGTAWVINSVVENPAFDAIPGGMNLNFHVIPNHWTISQFLGGLGGSMEWFFKQCWQGYPLNDTQRRDESISLYNEALEFSQAGSRGLICIPLSGNRQLPVYNAMGGFINLRMDHTLVDMGRAHMEGAAYEFRWAVENLLRNGMSIETLFMVGGATRSPYWPKIVSDVCGLKISTVQFSHGPALGAAMLACIGLGIHKNIKESQAVFNVSTQTIFPDFGQKLIYDQCFESYQHISQMISQ